jgi:uncharacterized protein YbaR (Trm112 family)
MALPRELLDILVCPKSKQPLLYFEAGEFLFCPASRLKYRIDQGVPVLLVDEATEVSEAESAQLVKKAKDLGLSSVDLSSNLR